MLIGINMIRVKISVPNMMVCDCGRPYRWGAADVAPEPEELGQNWAKSCGARKDVGTLAS